MQFNASLIVTVLIGTIALAPAPAPSAQPARGVWGSAVVSEQRAQDSEDAVWEADAGRGRVESRLDRSGATHRVLAAWTPLADALSPGEALPLSATALAVDADLPAGCTIEMVAWQGSGSEPRNAVRLLGTSLPADAPAGTLAQATAAWRVPTPSAACEELHVRVTVTHRGNAITLTRSYTWMPAGTESAD